MNQNLRRLAKIEAALALLQQRRKICFFLDIERDWTMPQIEAAADDLIAQAVAAGRLDPLTQEAMICRFWTAAEDQAMSDKLWRPQQWEERRDPKSRAALNHPGRNQGDQNE
jgi:hypothetical protein